MELLAAVIAELFPPSMWSFKMLSTSEKIRNNKHDAFFLVSNILDLATRSYRLVNVKIKVSMKFQELSREKYLLMNKIFFYLKAPIKCRP